MKEKSKREKLVDKTGEFTVVPNPLEGGYVFNGREEVPELIFDIYDSNGNKFYCNATKREAKKLVAELKAKGKDAIIGPVAPKIDDEGRIVKNKMRKLSQVYLAGIYIVKQKEEKDFTGDLIGDIKTTEEMAAEIGTADDNEVKSKVVEPQDRSEI